MKNDFDPFENEKNIRERGRERQKKFGERGPHKAPTKERITIRLSREGVEQFRESGDGWQARVDAALREWLKKHSPA
jgi:uncharacterized protein (DUF4415 family)